MYEKIIKPVLFRFEPERMHDLFVWIGEVLGSLALGRWLVGAVCRYEHPALRTRVAGIDFENPVGLAAGFDKDVRLTRIMPSVGFGHMEVGAVTRHPYGGNPGRRLARLPADRSLIVYYGLKNIGADAVEEKLKKLKFEIPVGINIAKTNRADIKGAASVGDYAATYRMLAEYFAYVTLNISCPNAQDGCTFQDPAMLDGLLAAIAREKKYGPVFLKLSTHLTAEEADAILAVVEKHSFVDGFVIGNLAKRRGILDLKSPKERLDLIPEGGISGGPVKELATNLIRHIYKRTGGRYAIIGLGGVFTAEDAYEKIKAGASLVQIITGLIYGGPLAVKRINRGLVKLLERDGYAHIAEAVGKAD
ncbi:MAG TPA: quinone-dependent dihydroorotate dehydrogenase [Candidatus Paceibacterota bacterium]|nr:quinone-dependent dihydroorotate dehydrogenase [Candidatus Paceibacterota bacterium]